MNQRKILSPQCRKKIAIVFPKDSESVFNHRYKTFGGATVQLYHYAMELSKYHDVYCLINEIEKIDYASFPLLHFQFTFSKTDGYLKKIIKFHRALMTVKPDIIIQRGLSRFSTFLGLYCRIYGMIYMFMFAHDRESRGRFQRSNRKNGFYLPLLFAAHHLVVQNDCQYNNIPENFKNKTYKLKSGYPLNLPIFTVKEGVLWVSRLEPWKRPELCIEAAVKNPDIPFLMIAPVDNKNKKYASKIYKMAENIKNITVVDFVRFKDVEKYFSESKLFLNTSLEEGFPNTFIQACSHNTPIISLSVNPDNFITKYSLGVYCKNDVEKMNREIRNLYNNDILINQYAETAFEYARQHHCIEKNTKSLEKLFA